MIRRTSILSIIILVIAAVIGCGGKPSHKPAPGTPGSTFVTQISQTNIHGMHVHAAQTTTTRTASLSWDGFLPVVHAQSTVTVAVGQNWEGICPNSPLSTGGTASIVINGIGQTTDPTCDHTWFNDTDGTVAANSATSGKLVYGAGTISNLVVSTDRGTVVASTGGVPVKLWVKRGQTILPTPVVCSLPTGGDELVCQSTATFAVQNLDRVIATATRSDGDVLVNLSVAFTKSIP